MTVKKNFLQKVFEKIYKTGQEENEVTWERETFSQMRRFGGKIVTMRMAKTR